MDEVKVCRKCKAALPATLEYFYRHSSTSDRLRGECRTCNNKQSREWSRANPVKKREYNLRITPEEYDFILGLQNGVCAICKKAPVTTLLAVDHCHETDIVRGLLCMQCNTGLGKFGDGLKLLRAAIKYLKEAGHE